MLTTKKEIIQCWLALFFTTGEFMAGVWLVIHEGHILAIYLAFTYALRETTGGKHYHDILVQAFYKIRLHKKYTVDNPFYKL